MDRNDEKKQPEPKKEPEPKREYPDRDYSQKPQVPDRPDRGGEGDFSGSNWGGERWSGRNWGSGRGR